jgi:uncharacterized tellurite resistance protein B-like protein
MVKLGILAIHKIRLNGDISMLSSLKSFLLGDEKSFKVDKTVSTDEKIAIATCTLLLEMAYSDDEFSDIEREQIVKIMINTYSIDENDADDIMVQAEKERESGIDLWQFTNKINEHYTKDEKMVIAKNLWEIIYADGKVDKHEEYLMRKLTSLLNLSHGDMINAKMKVIRK